MRGATGEGSDHEVEILFFPSVLYRSGQLLDIEYLTEAAHDRGVLAGFDLAHSVGVVPPTSRRGAWTSRSGVRIST